MAGAITVPAVLVLAAIWWLWWRLPKRQVARLALTIRDPQARADTEDNFRKTVGQVLGGAAVLIGAGLAYWQFTQQQQTAYQQILTQQKAAEDSRKASQDLLISNQVSKGFEQLAGTAMPMRLGGIYALEAVMNTSAEYHKPVLEALCAFVREGTRKPVEVKRPEESKEAGLAPDKVIATEPATDIQAALTVIGRRAKGRGAVDLTQVNIEGANLLHADLSGADLSGANLSNVILFGALLGGADLSGADLRGSNLGSAYLLSANLSHANLSGANLRGADLSGAGLRGADLSGANLRGANPSYANLSGANLSRADLSFTNLSGANLSGAVNLTQAQLDEACGKPEVLPEGLKLDKPCPPWVAETVWGPSASGPR